MIRVIALTLLLSVSAYPITNYYVHPNGDNSDGLTWAKAWTTLDSVNKYTEQSDTVYFGTGLWRGQLKLMQGTFANRTIYACSAFALTNIAGDQHYAQIYGSVNYRDSVWANVAGNVYKTHYAGTDMCGDTIAGGLCCQGDSILWLTRSRIDTAIYKGQDYDPPGPGPEDTTYYDGVDEPGEFYVTVNDTLYVYIYDTGSGYDPSNYDIECTKRQIIIIWLSGNSGQCGGEGRPDQSWISDSASYVTLYGLELKYGSPHIIGMYEIGKPDSLFIEHCKLSHVTGPYNTSSNVNPSLIYSSKTDHAEGSADYLQVTACSLGYGINYSTGNHGDGIHWYSASDVLIDSCTFYGVFTAYGVYAKCAYDVINSVNNVIRYSTFDLRRGGGVNFYFDTSNDSVYGNTFIFTDTDYPKRGAIKVSCSFESDPRGDIFFYNNTIFDGRGLQASEGTAEVCGEGKFPMENVQFKYNVLYATQAVIGSQAVASRNVQNIVREWYDSTGYFVFDSNLYCVDEQVYLTGGLAYGWAELDSADWAALGYDLNSRWVTDIDSIYWNDYANNDFSRPTISSEMNRTYGGKTWDIYGAIQNDASIGQTLTCTDTTTTSFDLSVDFTLVGTTIDTVIFECSIDDWSSVAKSDTIGSPSDPQTSTLSGLSLETVYKIRCRAWDTSESITDTSNVLTIDTSPLPKIARWKK